MNKFYVYQLVDSRNGNPFYIGKGTGPRMFAHLHDFEKGRVPNGNGYLFNKIKKIISLGYTVTAKKIADNLSEQVAFDIEKSEIRKYGKRGVGILCNLTDGGDGVSGYRHTPEQIQKQIVSLKKRFADPQFLQDHKHRMKVAHSTPDARKKNSQRVSEFYKSHPEQREKLSEIQRKLWKDGKYNNAKEWEFTSPSGEKIKIVNLQRFCYNNGLTSANMMAVAKGRRKHHRGWTSA